MPVDTTSYKSNAENSDKISARLIIEGKVQKVGMRHWIKQNALSLNILGWVRNKSDGSVEAFFFGNKDYVAQMISLCHKGPAFASVKKIKEIPQEETSDIEKEFMILPTL